MSSKNLSYTIKMGVVGKDKVVVLSDAIRQVGKELGTIPDKAQLARNKMMNFSAITGVWQGVYSGIQQVTSVMNTYIQKANAAAESQVKLTTIMRQRMNASEGEINSINQLISKQMELGVVGGTVQRSGLQQLATFATQKSTLEALLPAMNNLLVQQKGLNATSEDAVGIGNLMGKVLQGQSSALKRVGITFTEAEESTLKYGSEQEKAATLAQVITNNVGKMNEEMSKTDAGKMKQLSNEFSGLETKMGQFLSQYQSTIMVLGQVGMAVTGIGSVINGMRALASATGLTTLAVNGFRAAQASFAAMSTLLSAAINGTTMSLAGLRTAIRGTIMSLGLIGVAYLAVSETISYLTEKVGLFGSSTDDTNDKMKELKQSAEELKSSVSGQIGEYENAIATCKNFKGNKEEEKKIVDKLNATYGDTLGYFDSVSSWYSALIKNSQAYCDQLIIEAQMRQLANKIGENQAEYNSIKYNPDGSLKKYSPKRKTHSEYDVDAYGNPINKREVQEVGTSDVEKASSRLTNITRENNFLRRQMNELAGRLSKIYYPAKGSKYRNVNNMGYNQIKSEMADIDKQMDNKDLSESEYSDLASRRKTLQDRKNELDVESGRKSAPKAKKTTTKKDTYKTETQKIDDQLKKLKDQYINASDDTKDDLNAKIQTLERKKAEIELEYKKSEVPKNITTSTDAEKQLDYLEALRKLAKKEDIPAIDQLIYKTELFQASLNRPEDFTTLKDFDNEIAYQQKLLEGASKENVKSIQLQIDKLEELRDQFKEGYDLGSIDDLNATIQRKQTKANRTGNDNERKQLQAEIKVLQDELAEKTADYEKGSITDLQYQVQQIDEQLNKRDLTVEARMKLIADKDELQRQIDETTKGSLTIKADVTPEFIERGSLYDKEESYNNAQSKVSRIQQDFDNGIISKEEAKKQVDEVNRELSKLGQGIKPLKLENLGFDKIFSDIQNGWSNVEGVGSGIQSITKALSGNRNAWETLTGVIDGVIQVISSIQGVVQFVNRLTASTKISQAASMENAGSKIAEGAAAQTAAQQSTAAAIQKMTVEIPANKLVAASWMEVATAEYMAAHAYIPFAGFGIGAGFAASAKGLVLAMGNTAFATGGIVPGNSYSGDKVVAHVNSGEMILNAKQQARLFAIASGSLAPSMPYLNSPSTPYITMNTQSISGGGMPQSGQVVFKVKGRELYGVLESDGRLSSKTGKRYRLSNS